MGHRGRYERGGTHYRRRLRTRRQHCRRKRHLRAREFALRHHQRQQRYVSWFLPVHGRHRLRRAYWTRHPLRSRRIWRSNQVNVQLRRIGYGCVREHQPITRQQRASVRLRTSMCDPTSGIRPMSRALPPRQHSGPRSRCRKLNIAALASSVRISAFTYLSSACSKPPATREGLWWSGRSGGGGSRTPVFRAVIGSSPSAASGKVSGRRHPPAACVDPSTAVMSRRATMPVPAVSRSR